MCNGQVTTHTHCAFYTSDKLYKVLSFDYVWSCYVKYIMKCFNEDSEPSKTLVIDYIMTDILNFARVMPSNPVSTELNSMIQTMYKRG